jgi:hypothetical protein
MSNKKTGEMKTQMILRKLCLLIVCSCMIVMTSFGQRAPRENPGRAAIKALILVDDHYGGSLNIEDNENYLSYGWEVTLACCTEEVSPCPWASMHGCEVITADLLTSQLDNALEWDVITVAPGETHENIMACPYVLDLLAEATDNGIPVSAWCRGVRVLAAADIIDGVSITGHIDYEDEYLAAGADYLGNAEPPTEDMGIITAVKSNQYRSEMCELTMEAVENALSIKKDLAKKKEDFCLKIYPNPIVSSATIDFDMKKSGEAHIMIFDRKGNMVLDVVKHTFDSGHNRVTFTPSSLPSGVYYLYLITSECRAMRKCMII